MLETMELIVGYILLITSSLPFGILSVRGLYPQLLEKSKAVSLFFVSFFLGIPFMVGLLWIASQVLFSLATIIFIGLTSYIILVTAFVKFPIQEKESSSQQSRFFSLENGLFTVFILISVGFFGAIALFLGWSQVGDPWRVGAMVSLIIENGHLPTTYAPISDTVMGYPLGFPVLCAAVSVVSGSVPAVSQLIVSSLIMALIPV
ncbi:MAG: hypothetical protein ACXAAQ_14160, partial [Candidatus Thorarchaeota archaeon]